MVDITATWTFDRTWAVESEPGSASQRLCYLGIPLHPSESLPTKTGDDTFLTVVHIVLPQVCGIAGTVDAK